MLTYGARCRVLLVGATSVLFPLVLQGCAERRGASARWNGTKRDSAGVAIIENRDTPLWGPGDAWTFTKVLRIGVADGDPAYMFGGVTGLVRLTDGRVVIGDGQNHTVRFFSPEGVLLATVGKGGAGPGEFSGFINLLLGPGDTILAVDYRNARGNIISPDGESVRSFPALPTGGFWTYDWDDDETTRTIVSFQRPLQGDAAPADARYDLVMRRDLTGAFLDTLAKLPTSEMVSGQGDARLIHYYRGGPDYDVCDGHIVTGHSEQYRLTWQGLDGTIQRIVTLDREPEAFTDADRDVILRRFDRMAQQNQIPLERAAEIKSRYRFEARYPAFRRFVCGPQGTLIVQRVKPLRELTNDEFENQGFADRPPGADEWDVFDREGRYLGVVSMPTLPHRHAFSHDRTGVWFMAGVELDESDVAYASVWRIDGLQP